MRCDSLWRKEEHYHYALESIQGSGGKLTDWDWQDGSAETDLLEDWVWLSEPTSGHLQLPLMPT